MTLSKSSVVGKIQHHLVAFNKYKNFLIIAIDNSSDHISEHDLDSFNVSLNNMREEIESIENFISQVKQARSDREARLLQQTRE